MLQDITRKVHDGTRLSREDGLTLFACPDTAAIGALANVVRRRLHGDAAYYNVNRHLNYSNVCILSCRFCEFQRKPGQDGAYEFSLEDIESQARAAADAGATEIHMVGGLHPKLRFEYYLDALRTIKAAAPRIHIKAFTAVELVHLARVSKRALRADFAAGVKSVLADLRDAGLDSLPGGGAEVFDDRAHDEAWRGKIRSDQWLTAHRAAHELGIFSNATMLYGHIEDHATRVDHLLQLRAEQDHALDADLPARFNTLIPLPFFPDGSALEHLPGPTGRENLRMLAIARLMLDNFPHLKAFWIMQTLPMAQVMLDYGADDMDGTVVWYDITKVGGSTTHQEVSIREMRQTIAEAGYRPIERDTLYRPIDRDPDTGAWSLAEFPAEPTSA